jgi:hypothetical protein
MNMRKRMMTYSLTKKNSKADGSKEIGSGFKVQGSKSIVLKGGIQVSSKIMCMIGVGNSVLSLTNFSYRNRCWKLRISHIKNGVGNSVSRHQ